MQQWPPDLGQHALGSQIPNSGGKSKIFKQIKPRYEVFEEYFEEFFSREFQSIFRSSDPDPYMYMSQIFCFSGNISSQLCPLCRCCPSSRLCLPPSPPLNWPKLAPTCQRPQLPSHQTRQPQVRLSSWSELSGAIGNLTSWAPLHKTEFLPFASSPSSEYHGPLHPATNWQQCIAINRLIHPRKTTFQDIL